MKRLAALVFAGLALTACYRPDPPLKFPSPVLPPVSPAGTRPLPSALLIQPCHPRLDGSPRRCIVWGEASDQSWHLGPYDPDPAYAGIFCNFNPDRGDVYRSEANGLVLTAPEGCPS